MYEFDKYRAQVLLDYEERKAANQLSFNLVHPTPTSLKEEAIKVCQSRFKRSDENVMVSFFDHQPDVSEYILAITRSDADCFRPICNFLRGRTIKPEERQIEMLAWLIDFKHRPYQVYIKDGLHQTRDTDTVIIEDELFGPDDHKGLDKRPTEEKRATTITTTSPVTYKKTLIWLSVPLLLLIGGYVFLNFIIKQKCMHWNGEAYEIVSCDAFQGEPLVIQYDPVKLSHFKMITHYDTLTRYSLGKVWYVKRNGEVEFYTSAGVHPVNPDLKLKPLTDYILNTTVRQKREQLILSSSKQP